MQTTKEKVNTFMFFWHRHLGDKVECVLTRTHALCPSHLMFESAVRALRLTHVAPELQLTLGFLSR